MQQIVTAKLKLVTEPKQSDALRAVCLASRDAMNYASQIAFGLGKTSNALAIHKACYREARTRFSLPSQLTASAIRYTSAAYKSLWTKAKDHAKKEAARCAAKPKRRYRSFKGLDKAPKFTVRTLTYQEAKDFSFKTGQRVSVMTLDGRMAVPYLGWDRHVALIQKADTHIGAAKLLWNVQKRAWFLYVSLTVTLPDPDPSDHKTIVGVDVGQRYLAVATDTRQNSFFASGTKARHKANRYRRARASLQRKDTRSGKRRLRLQSGRERRFQSALNHQIARKIVGRFPSALIGLEDLTHVRERTERHSRRNTKKKDSTKQKRANGNKSHWSFRELQEAIAYKATLAGSFAVKVLAHYSSQACPSCGYTSKENRPSAGLLFRCQACRLELHADLVGARNLALRTLLTRQDWVSTGCLSTSHALPSKALDVSDGEAKAESRAGASCLTAECLRRYSELRWSPEAKVEALV